MQLVWRGNCLKGTACSRLKIHCGILPLQCRRPSAGRAQGHRETADDSPPACPPALRCFGRGIPPVKSCNMPFQGLCPIHWSVAFQNASGLKPNSTEPRLYRPNHLQDYLSCFEDFQQERRLINGFSATVHHGHDATRTDRL